MALLRACTPLFASGWAFHRGASGVHTFREHLYGVPSYGPFTRSSASSEKNRPFYNECTAYLADPERFVDYRRTIWTLHDLGLSEE